MKNEKTFSSKNVFLCSNSFNTKTFFRLFEIQNFVHFLCVRLLEYACEDEVEHKLDAKRRLLGDENAEDKHGLVAKVPKPSKKTLFYLIKMRMSYKIISNFIQIFLF